MVKVAIAGGSSATLGHSIVSALLATNGRHTPIILSRKKKEDGPDSTWSSWPLPSSSPSASPSSSSTVRVETRYVKYDSHDSLVAALHDIDTVISVLLVINPELFVKYQVNLLHAAETAGCKRFAPSAFAHAFDMHHKVPGDAAVKIPVWNEVKKSNIDSALFPCGMFMNYLGIGCPEAGGNRKEALAGFKEGPLLFHLAKDEGYIEVPVMDEEEDSEIDGGKPLPILTMTDIRDVGRFVAAAIDLEEPWGKRELGMAGSILRLDEMIALCEKYTGQKMEIRRVTKKSLEESLREKPVDLEGIMRHVENQYKNAFCGTGVVVEPVLNRLCPDVHPMSAEDYLRRHWAEAS